MTDDLYYRKLESTSTIDLVDMIREKDKRIAELEKENAELKKINADGLSELNHINGELIIENEKLHKENAELKGLIDVATLIRANNDTVTTLMQLNNMLVSKNQQLTKAKEILKAVVDFYPTMTATILLEAEQFLGEVEK